MKTNLSKSAQKAMTTAVPKPGTKTKQPTTNTKPTKVKT